MFRAFAVLSVVIGLLAGCVSQSKYQTLETQTSAERVSLEQEISSLRSQRQELEGQKKSLERQLSALRDEVGRRETELSSVNEQLSSLSQESTTQRSELEAQKLSLQHQIATLNDRLSETEQRSAELASQKDDLANQKAQLAAQKDEEIRRLRGTHDTLVKDLESEIAKGEIKVKQIRDRLSVQLVEKILFDSGKTDIKAQGKAVLDKVGNVLRNVTDKQFRIEGYTDSVPISAGLRSKFPTNWELSTRRATTVLRFLQDTAGVDGKYLSAVGYGPHRPVAANDTEQGRAENRRIEIVLTPLDAGEMQ
ncbi:MAG: OmpA family protein [Candidatus Rokuibacteriota bacterium]